jgi:hypothetical protein
MVAEGTATRVAGLRITGTAAPMVVEGPKGGNRFEAHGAQVLVPVLRPGEEAFRAFRP